ncbi:MAG TPA: hypothetical protein VLK37_00945 [Solirubrobacterales bacterium]|nr:hypothetical protein [Solirubrobacterales bacterium]
MAKRFLIVNADALGFSPAVNDAERQIELTTLRDPGVKNLLNVSDVRLCSLHRQEHG